MPVVTTDKQPKQGKQTVTATAKPLTQIGSNSSGNTTFSQQADSWRITDGSAWDLSDVEVDFVAKTSGGWKGRITAVNDGSNYVEVRQFQRYGTNIPQQAAKQPVDGEVVTIHKMEVCEHLILDADDANTVDIFMGFDSDVAISGDHEGHPIAAASGQPNHRVILENGLGDYIDLLSVYVITSTSAVLHWIGS